MAKVPEHEGLLLTAARGLTQYSYVYVDYEAFETEQTQPQKAQELRQRAKTSTYAAGLMRCAPLS